MAASSPLVDASFPDSVRLDNCNVALKDCLTVADEFVYYIDWKAKNLCRAGLHSIDASARASVQAAIKPPFGLQSGGRSGSGKVQCVILLNPFSGKGRARSTWASVKPLFDAFEGVIELQVIETESAGHAWKLGRELDLLSTDVVLTISGDGLLHELVNGLLSRSDAMAGSVPASTYPSLGIIPAGSGNGLAKSVTHQAGLECTAFACAFVALKGRPTAIDVQSYKPDAGDGGASQSMALPNCGPQECRYGFLSFAWGLVADIDIESERCRCLGALRFTLEAVCKIFNLRTYKGQFTYREHVSSGSGGEQNGSHVSEEKSIEGPFTMFLASNVTHLSEDSHLTPRAQLSDGAMDIVLLRKIKRCALLCMFLDTESGAHVNNPNVEYLKVRSFRLQPKECIDGCCCCWPLFCRCCCPPVTRDTGHCVVDGEVVPYGNLECTVLPGCLNLLL